MKVIRTEGPTPAGGAYSEAVFMDDGGNVVDRARATQVRIVEYDAKGERIRETWGFIEK